MVGLLDTYQARIEAINAARQAVKEAREQGLALAKAKRELRSVECKTIISLKAEGMSATAISNALKSQPEVADAQFAVDCAEVLYKAASEEVNVNKLDARLLEADIAREWSQEGRGL